MISLYNWNTLKFVKYIGRLFLSTTVQSSGQFVPHRGWMVEEKIEVYK